MTEDSALAGFISGVRESAAAAGALIIESLVDPSDAIPTAAVDQDELFALIRHARPRLIYLFQQTFEPEDLFEDEEIAQSPKAKALAKSWRPRRGQIARATAATVVDSVLHAILVNALWYAEIEAAAEALVEEFGAIGEENRSAKTAADRKIVEACGKALAADPRFTMPKASKAKRQHLAESMFPNVAHGLLWAIVEKAESIAWLQASER